MSVDWSHPLRRTAALQSTFNNSDVIIVIVVVGAGIVRQERFLRSKFLHFPVTSRNIMHFSIRTRRSMNRSFKKILLANRRQKARVEVVEEVMRKMPVKVLGEDRELQDENQDENPKEGGGSQKFGKRAVIFKKREPKRMSYLDALMKSKTEKDDHDQNTIKSKIVRFG